MKILHLSITDTVWGAARAAVRLHGGLRRLGHESKMLVLRHYSDDPDVLGMSLRAAGLPSRLRRRLRRGRIRRDWRRYLSSRPSDMGMFTDDRTEHGDALARQLPASDVITLHLVAGMLDHEGFFSTLPRLFPGVPLVWRLPEMSPFTGGCHYDGGCGKFTARCGACPQLRSSDPHDLSRQIWLRKRRSFAHLPAGGMHLVAPSNWIAAQAKRSSLMGGYPITIIPNGLDVDDFRPLDRAAVREALQVPPRAKVVLFVSSTLNNRRKGLAVLSEAMRQLAGDKEGSGLLLLTIGSGQPAFDRRVPCVHLGNVTNDRVMRMAYNAADVLAMPPSQESFGQTVVESMACGTPVAAFATGGMLDTVRPGRTGFLAPPGDAVGLAEVIGRVIRLSPEAWSAMSAECRNTAVAEYSFDLQARRYEKLYQGLIAHRDGGPVAEGSIA
jgi:glycosyltransferase involved in cell wall biosynthesis